MTNKIPDRWVIVEIKNNDNIIRKVLGSWYGGFADADSWQLSSGVVRTTETENSFEFINESGSIYSCYKNSYGMSGYTAGIYADWKEKLKESPNISLRILTESEIKEGIL